MTMIIRCWKTLDKEVEEEVLTNHKQFHSDEESMDWN